MPHIIVDPSLPGIRALLAFRPETARPLAELADILLHQSNSLSPGDRELIAAYVSSLNDCTFCKTSHAAIASVHAGDAACVSAVLRDPESAPISTKMRALLMIAARVQESGLSVRPEHVARARDAEIGRAHV